MKQKKLNMALCSSQAFTILCMLAVLLCFMQFATPTLVYSPDSTVAIESGDQVSTGSANWADTGVSVVKEVQEGFVKILMAVVVVAGLAAGGLLLFAKDERSVSTAIRWLVRIVIGAFIILLLNGGEVVNVIKGFAEKFGGTA